MQRELSSFLLAPCHRQKLQAAGFFTAQDVIELKPSELSEEVGLSKEAALDVLRLIKQETDRATDGNKSGGVSALELLQREQQQPAVITFCQELDELVGGGVPVGKITEFCGAPGVGKTQISMQLAVDVTLPTSFGGLGAQALYVDTEGSFFVDRVRDIAMATVKHCQHIAEANGQQDQIDAVKSYTTEHVLESIHYMRCHDYIQLLAVARLLSDFIKQHPAVKLIVIDSIAFHFRHDFSDLSLRTRLLNGLAQTLIQQATQHKLAVVLTNQMTTKIHKDGGGSSLVPALGESWGHAPTLRVILHWKGDERQATLYKSPAQKEATVSYQITPAGVRDVCQPEDMETSDQPSKRQRTS